MSYYYRVISEKNGCDFNAYNNVRGILYNNDVITNIVKLIVHSPVGKLVSIISICFFFSFLFNISNISYTPHVSFSEVFFLHISC